MIPGKFIVVDDDPINNQLCKFNLRKTYPDVEILCFELPAEGLQSLKALTPFENPQLYNCVLLDINMPEINGWEFLEQFSLFEQEIKEHVKIFIVSSSIDPMDVKKAQEHPLVVNYLTKPISKDMLIGFQEV
ncbi:MAG: response regulator [Bacteroidia bacterium]|nr:response regulator [Bacteroidia bacterium]